MSSTSTLTIRESAFQATVIEYAERCGWRVAHFADSRREVVDRDTGERKLIGDEQSEGFPDLVLVRGDVLIFAELKSAKGRVSARQQAWLWDLSQVEEPSGQHVKTFLWRPEDWPTIERLLRRSFAR